MRPKGVLFSALVLIVLAAGCTGGQPTGRVTFDQNAGIKIDQFAFDISELFEKETATLTLKVQNVGAKSMTSDSKLWVYGPQMVKVDSVPPATPADKWATTENIPITKTLSTSTFLPPDVERGIPGSVDVQTITLAAPLVPESMKNDYTFYARVCYPYSTTSMTKLVATTRNQLRTEDVKKTDAITRASAGPVQLKMLSGENLIAGRPMQLVFDVTDVGGGFATLADTSCTARTAADISTSDLNKVKVTVKVDGTAACTDKTITLSSGKGTLYCTYTPGATESPKTEYTVTAEAKYNYFLTQQTSITAKDESL